jgi:hypothetical protein
MTEVEFTNVIHFPSCEETIMGPYRRLTFLTIQFPPCDEIYSMLSKRAVFLLTPPIGPDWALLPYPLSWVWAYFYPVDGSRTFL